MRHSLLVASLVRAWREPRLVLLLWALQLVPALLVVAPLAAFLGNALARAPEGDAFLARLDLPLLADLIEANRAAFKTLGPLSAALVVAGLLANAFFAGGALEVLLRADSRPLAVRFARGGGRYFARFLRMGLVTIPIAALAAGLLSAPIWIVRASLSFRAEGAKFWLGFAGAGAAAIGAVAILLALDFARLRVARDDSRRAVRVLLRSVPALLRRPGVPLALWLALGALLLVAVALLSALRSAVGVESGVALVATLILMQLAIAARAFYRVALWCGEIRLVECRSAERG